MRINPLERQVLDIFMNSTQQALQSYDLNRDGVIDQNELIQLFQQMGYDWNIASQMSKNILSQLDTDQNAYISIDDFQRQMHSQSPDEPLNQLERQVLDVFRSHTQQVLQDYDFNRDGIIDLNELIQLFQRTGYDQSSASQMASSVLDQLDQDGNGHISRHDFQSHMRSQSPNEQENQLVLQVLNSFRNNTQRAIQAYDFNRDGVIDLHELTQLFQQIGLDRESASQLAENVLSQLDADRDGHISLNDFQRQINVQSFGEPLNPLEQQVVDIFRNNTQQALQAYDFNRDGVIDLNELIHLFQQTGCDPNSASQMARNVFAQLDTDQNGYINLADFQRQI